MAGAGWKGLRGGRRIAGPGIQGKPVPGAARDHREGLAEAGGAGRCRGNPREDGGHPRPEEPKRCAGSVFRRPPGHYAGKLIEEAGCGGLRVGGAEVSHRHKGFIVNTGSATARDVRSLIEMVKVRVLESSGVKLETEVLDFSEVRFPLD
ncbi:MAG: hypothetical protein FJ109_14515 [Deltaproteobacteria bacterium]|nr:hypothetical protein [Deltaproteobacteria bacterium]